MATSTATRNKVIFISKNGGLRLIRRNAESMMNPSTGTMVPTRPELTYEFEGGVFEATEGKDLLEEMDEFGETTVKDQVQWLRDHPDYGIRLEEVVPVAPDPAPLLAEIFDAYQAKDIKALELLGDEEQGSWNRPEIMDRIGRAYRELADAPKPKAPAKE